MRSSLRHPFLRLGARTGDLAVACPDLRRVRPVQSTAGVGHFCVNCGAPLVSRVIDGRELEACPNDSFVLWRDPKVATAVVVEVDGGIVLGRRSIEPGYGLWCLPGGFVNDDEGPAAAAMRECLEEISAEVELTGLIGVYHIAKTGAPSMVGISYRGRLADGARLKRGAEMLEVGVFQLDSLPELAFPSHRGVLAEYLKSQAKVEAEELRSGPGAAPRVSLPSPPRARKRPQHRS